MADYIATHLYCQELQSSKVAGESPNGSPGGPDFRANAHISAYIAGCPGRSTQLPEPGGGGGGGCSGGTRQKFVMSLSPHI